MCSGKIEKNHAAFVDVMHLHKNLKGSLIFDINW